MGKNKAAGAMLLGGVGLGAAIYFLSKEKTTEDVDKKQNGNGGNGGGNGGNGGGNGGNGGGNGGNGGGNGGNSKTNVYVRGNLPIQAVSPRPIDKLTNGDIKFFDHPYKISIYRPNGTELNPDDWKWVRYWTSKYKDKLDWSPNVWFYRLAHRSYSPILENTSSNYFLIIDIFKEETYESGTKGRDINQGEKDMEEDGSYDKTIVLSPATAGSDLNKYVLEENNDSSLSEHKFKKDIAIGQGFIIHKNTRWDDIPKPIRTALIRGSRAVGEDYYKGFKYENAWSDSIGLQGLDSDAQVLQVSDDWFENHYYQR